MGRIKNRYDINQCSLYKCISKKKLISLLKINNEIYENIDSIIKYHTFSIPKKSSAEERIITAPCDSLKIIQSRLLRLLQYVERPDWLMSGEKGKCYIDNARKHIDSKFFLTLDIKQFYDNCKREYVFNFFKNRLLMAGDLAGFCTDIVTYEGGIPTGCPTSQLIAYYAYEEMFFKIFEIAHKNNCIYTLYVDDIAMSSVDPLNGKKLTSEIDRVLRRYGHRLKYRKIRYYTSGDSALITGVIINNHTLKIPNKLQRKIHEDYIKLIKQEETNVEEENKRLLEHIRGELTVAKNIEPGRFPEINRFVNSK